MKLDKRMADAMALVRAGRPMEATRLIQAITAGVPSKTPAAADAQAAVIDLVASSIHVSPGKSPAPTAERGTFRSRHSDLAYLLHKPADLPEGAPLLLMLHGCTQTAEDFAVGTRMNDLAAAAGMAVLWPEQSARSNPRKCWRWYEAAHQRVDQGEPALLLALARHAAAENGLDASTLFVAGLSAGGAMAAVLADCAPDTVRAVAVHSGLAAGVAASMAGGLAAMQKAPSLATRDGRFVPMMIFHGDADSVVAPGNANALFAGAIARAEPNLRVEELAATWGQLTVGRDSGGHIRASRYLISGAGHNWSGGDPAGSYASATGPDASAEMLRFFDTQRRHPLQAGMA